MKNKHPIVFVAFELCITNIKCFVNIIDFRVNVKIKTKRQISLYQASTSSKMSERENFVVTLTGRQQRIIAAAAEWTNQPQPNRATIAQIA